MNFLLLAGLVILAPIVKFPPGGKPSGVVSYSHLVCTQEDRDHIYEIVSTLAEEGKVSLLFKQNHLKEIGLQIAHVHPLKFLSVVFTNPYLKECMALIYDDSFKRNGFIDGSGSTGGIGSSLTRESEKGTIDAYLKDFCDEVKVPVRAVKEYCQNRDWEGFVQVLLTRE